MNIFKSKRKSLQLEISAEYFIAAQVDAKGTIETESDVFIDGNFKGKIESAGLVEIGKNAKVEGSLQARALLIEGKLTGLANAKDDIKISRCAIIDADLACGEIELEKGALVSGKLKVKR